MNTATNIYKSDSAGVVHVHVPVGAPGRCVEVVVVWQDAIDTTPEPDSEGVNMSDLVGLLEGVELERPPTGEYENRDSLG